MKKLDLHIHTVSSISDYQFEFSLTKLQEYVSKLKLDCIAITNHNLFDLQQFQAIVQSLPETKVLPGIEINLEKGHLLLLSEDDELSDFETKCKQVELLIQNKKDCISVETMIDIFGDLNKYLLIPHYKKNPVVSDETLKKLSPHIFVGEVTSVAKFKACLDDPNELTPVIFSDVRISTSLDIFPPRQIFLNLDEISLKAIKGCLYDRKKITLSEQDGNNLFQVTDDGLYLSTGLNVILGERSSGKTFTLNKICKSFENVKFIEQFSLLQNSKEKFEYSQSLKNVATTDLFLNEFEQVVSDVRRIDLKQNSIKIEKFLNSLLKFASESDKLDSYSKAKLFSETLFVETDLSSLSGLIKATILLIENSEYRTIIDSHVDVLSLKGLVQDLILRYNELRQANLQKQWLNVLITNIRSELRSKSMTTAPEEIDFFEILLENEKVKKFNKIVEELHKERIIMRQDFRGFKIIAVASKFTGAQQLKLLSKSQSTFSEAFQHYSTPHKYLRLLSQIPLLAETEHYKYFCNIEYHTLNKHNIPVSGGERSEFNLLQEIKDALKYDLLLIDEPESSFDNIFLKNDVNELIREISTHIPVIVTTHNSTVGASIRPNFLVYTHKEILENEVKYFVFSGNPSNKLLKALDGSEIGHYDVLMRCLEAGTTAYEERQRTIYDILKN